MKPVGLRSTTLAAEPCHNRAVNVTASAEAAVADLIVARDCGAERIAVAGGFEIDRAGFRAGPKHGVRLIGGGSGLTDLNEARGSEARELVKPVGLRSTTLAAVPLHSNACVLPLVNGVEEPEPTWLVVEIPYAVEVSKPAGFRSMALAAVPLQRRACGCPPATSVPSPASRGTPPVATIALASDSL